MEKEAERDPESTIQQKIQTLLSIEDDLNCIEDLELKDELKFMPGSFIKKIYELWVSLYSPNDGEPERRTNLYFQNLLSDSTIGPIRAFKDKIRGAGGIDRTDTGRLLECCFRNWKWSKTTQDFKPFSLGTNDRVDIKEIISQILDLIFANGTTKILLLLFEGFDTFRFHYQQPAKAGITFISNKEDSILELATPFSNFQRIMQPYFVADPEKSKGAYAWVIDLTDIHIPGVMKNYFSIVTNLLSLKLSRSDLDNNDDLFAIRSHSSYTDDQYSDFVELALKERFAVIVRGLPSNLSNFLVKKFKEQEEPDSREYERLLKKTSYLNPTDFIFGCLTLQESTPELLRIFVGNPENGDNLNVSRAVTVEPIEGRQSVELSIRHWATGKTVKAANKGRSSEVQYGGVASQEIHDLPITHDQAYSLLFLATSHRLDRNYIPAETTSSQNITSGYDAIWALRRNGYEVMSADQFLQLVPGINTI